MRTKRVTREYEVDRKLMGILIFLEDMVFESSETIPKEIMEYTKEYYDKVANFAGIEEEKYLKWDLTDLRYKMVANFEENKKVKK